MSSYMHYLLSKEEVYFGLHIQPLLLLGLHFGSNLILRLFKVLQQQILLKEGHLSGGR